MKKTVKKMLCAVIALSLIVCVAFPVGAWAVNEAPAQLKFSSDGKFKILQFADTQDDMLPRRAMIMLMEKAIEIEKPDLIVFTGDNTNGGITKLLVKIAIDELLKPVVKSGIPFTFVFGNHDAENVNKEYQLSVYQNAANCLAVDAKPELTGCATHNLEIKSSDGTKTAFNLWMIDSNMYSGDYYDNVHEDQLNWYKAEEAKLKAANGGVSVPSLVFQHICVPEIYEVLQNAPADSAEVTKTYNGQKKLLKLNPDMASGTIGEWPCPPAVNSGEFDAFVATGDVKGIVTGHDHVNNFVGTYKGIDFIQTIGAGFQTYGNELRGYRVITLNEGDGANPYDTCTKSFYDIFGSDIQGKFMFDYYGSEIAALLPACIGKALTKFVTTSAGERFYLVSKGIFDKIGSLFD